MTETMQPSPLRRTVPGLLAAFVLLYAAQAWGIDHSGTCTGTFTAAQNPHRLVGFCQVPAGQTLTIQPGVILLGQNNTLQISGTLNAVGSVANKISSNDLYWSFQPGAAGTLTNCTINGPAFSWPISITDASPTISNCTLGGGLYYAITITGSSLASPAMPAISGNLIDGAYYGIQVSGTARPSLTGNQITTNYSAIEFSGEAAGTASGNTVNFVAEGSSGRRGIAVSGNAAPTIDANTINDDPNRNDWGIILELNPGSAVVVTNNTVRASAEDVPLNLSPNAFAPGPVISGNLFPTGVGAGFGLLGTLTTAVSVGPLQGQSRYTLTGTLSVGAGGTLTVLPGMEINGRNNSLQVAAGGTLTAVGTSAAQRDVHFSNVYISFQGPGDPAAAGTLSNCTISGPAFSWPISITDASPTISNCSLGGGLYYAIAISGSSLASPAMPAISGNLIEGAYYGIQVSGTARPLLTGNQITTNYSAIEFSGEAAGTASGNTVNFVVEGSSGRRGIAVSGNAAPTIDANTINDDPGRTDWGIILEVNPGSGVRVTNNTVRASGEDVPLNLSPNAFAPGPVISGNLFPTGTARGIGVQGTLTTTATMGPLQGVSSYVLTSTFTVAAGATLSIAPGTRLNGRSNLLQVNAGGTLNALGTSAAERDVRFEELFIQFAGPDFSGNGPSGGALANCEILRGPAFFFQAAAVQITDAAPSISTCTIRDNETGIMLSGDARPVLQNNRFARNTRAVVVASGGGKATAGANVFDRNTFSLSFNDENALFSSFPDLFDSNTFAGSPDQNLVEINFYTVSSGGTVPAASVPYLVRGMEIDGGATVLVEPGVVFRNASFSTFTVNGELLAGGTPDAPIVFTAQSPKSGARWGGLTLNNQAPSGASFLASAIVEFAGAFGSVPALRLSNSSINVSNSTITANAGVGMEITNAAAPQIVGTAVTRNQGHGIVVSSGARPQFSRTSILRNGGFGMRNEDCPFVATPIAAERIYWGHDSGPRDDSDDRAGGGLYNPAGLGDRVGDCIDYDPWTRLAPAVEGVIVPVSGGGQSGPVGSLLPAPVCVEVRSPLASPLAGIDVTFSVAAGEGTIETGQPVRTGADGRACSAVRLGLTPGTLRIAVTARDVNSPLATFAAEVASGAAGTSLGARALAPAVRRGRHGVGDVNDDGRLDLVDAALIEQLATDPERAEQAAVSGRADLNADGTVDHGDALLALRRLAGARGHSPWPRGDTPGRSLRAYLRPPRTTPTVGEAVRIPVYVRPGAEGLAAYALQVAYDRSVLALVAIDGGVAHGFADGPVANPRDFRRGRVTFAAVNRGALRTPRFVHVADLVFRVIAPDATRTSVELGPARRGVAVVGRGYAARPLRAARGLTLTIRAE